jgi:myo-inositol 2-dehydrogenase/D-chiro-inositol 1-dehydrogenase
MIDRVRIGIVGAGGIAKRHVEALRTIEHAQIVGMVDVETAKAAQLAQTCGAQVFATLDDCLPHVDLVYVLTPPTTHRDLVCTALTAGKHVVVEKPLAAEIADGETMVAAARTSGAKLMTAFNMRFRTGFRRLQETLAAGVLGEPISIWSHRLGIGVGAAPNWRTTPGLLCGMTVESLSHDLDLIAWLGGEIVRVAAHTRETHADLPGFDDNAVIIATLSGGVMASIHASWSSHLAYNARGIVGTEGTAMVTGRGLWDLTTFHLKTAAMPYETIEVLNDTLDVASYREESRHFVDCVRHDRTPSITGEDGLRALRVSHAIMAAHRQGKTVDIAAPALA